MIGLLACSAQKLSRAAAARELYTSDLFGKSLAYLEARGCSSIYVLSAKHGLVELHRTLQPYNHTLKTNPDAQRWAEGVAGELFLLHGHDVELLVLAGERYAAPLVHELVHIYGFNANDIALPLRGMQIGERLAWLKSELRRVAAAQFVAPVDEEMHTL